MTDTKELVIPDAAKQGDPKAFEILRVWVAKGGQHMSLRAGAWADPAAWGLLLVDVARHVANAYQQEAGRDQLKTLQRIKAAWDLEWGSPTDRPSGEVRR